MENRVNDQEAVFADEGEPEQPEDIPYHNRVYAEVLICGKSL